MGHTIPQTPWSRARHLPNTYHTPWKRSLIFLQSIAPYIHPDHYDQYVFFLSVCGGHDSCDGGSGVCRSWCLKWEREVPGCGAHCKCCTIRPAVCSDPTDSCPGTCVDERLCPHEKHPTLSCSGDGCVCCLSEYDHNCYCLRIMPIYTVVFKLSAHVTLGILRCWSHACNSSEKIPTYS